MADSVTQQLMFLLEVGGVPISIREAPGVGDGAVDRTVAVPFPSRWIRYRRALSGSIKIKIQPNECLAVTMIDVVGVNYSNAATIAINNNTNTVARPSQPLQLVAGQQTLYVFPPGTAIFTFVFSALPFSTARVQVEGFRLPIAAFNALSALSSEDVDQ